jgi:hypothetical protein
MLVSGVGVKAQVGETIMVAMTNGGGKAVDAVFK